MNNPYLTPTVLLGAGDYPTHPLALDCLAQAERVICCDGAAYNYIRHGDKPWRIVGDCDSILAPSTPEERQILDNHRHLIRRFTGQDDNDQTKAVRYCLEHGWRQLTIVGATGRREDHTLGNISLLIEYLHMGADVRMITDYGVFIPCHDRFVADIVIPDGFKAVSDTEATRQKSTQVSVFNISAHDLHAQGLRYPLSDFTQWWQGTLNEAIASPIIIEGQGDFLVYIAF